MIQAISPKAWLKERKTWHSKVISESIVDDGSLGQIIESDNQAVKALVNIAISYRFRPYLLSSHFSIAQPDLYASYIRRWLSVVVRWKLEKDAQRVYSSLFDTLVEAVIARL